MQPEDGKIEGRGIGRASGNSTLQGNGNSSDHNCRDSAIASIRSAEPALVSLTIRGGKKEINTKGRLSLRVMGKNSDGREIEIKDGVRWESSDKRIATVNPKGEVIGQREGTVDIIARSGNIASKPLSLVIKALAKRREAQAARGLSADKLPNLTTIFGLQNRIATVAHMRRPW